MRVLGVVAAEVGFPGWRGRTVELSWGSLMLIVCFSHASTIWV